MTEKTQYLIIRYHSGELSEVEARELSSWVSSSPEAALQFKKELARIDSLSEEAASEDASAFWTRVDDSNSKRQSVLRSRRYSTFRQVVAAVCICGAIVAGITYVPGLFHKTDGVTVAKTVKPVAVKTGINDSIVEFEESLDPVRYASTTYEATSGAILPVTLPDGSVVTLNKEAKLTVCPGFGEKTRNVKLNGEAFFDVAKDAEHPFCVFCQDEKFIVRGTSFNIVSYASDNYSMVTLHTGSLEAYVKDDHLLLSPGDQLCIDQADDNISRRRVDVSKSIAWMNDDILSFTSLPLKYVCSQMSHKYGVKISAHDSIANILYEGSIDDEPLDVALRLLTITAPVKLHVANLDGEYYLTKLNDII